MFFNKIEKAKADWPHSKTLKRSGCIHITGKYAQPALIPNMVGLFFLAVIGLWFGLGFYFFDTQPEVPYIAAAVFGCTYWILWKPLFIALFGKNVDVKIFMDKIQVKGWFGYKNYSREVPIEFRVERHHKAINEVQKEHQTQKVQSRKYREAVEVVMQYGEKRVVIAELIEKEMEKAKALNFRLQDVCKEIDQALKEEVEGNQANDNTSGDFGPEPEIR